METVTKRIVEMSLDEILARLREKYDEQRQMDRAIEDAVAPLQREMERIAGELRDDLIEVETDIKALESQALELARRSDLDELEKDGVAITRVPGRRKFTARPHEIPEEYKGVVTKTTVSMITMGELDRLMKDRPDIDWAHVSNLTGLIREDGWTVRDVSRELD